VKKNSCHWQVLNFEDTTRRHPLGHDRTVLVCKILLDVFIQIMQCGINFLHTLSVWRATFVSLFPLFSALLLTFVLLIFTMQEHKSGVWACMYVNMCVGECLFVSECVCVRACASVRVRVHTRTCHSACVCLCVCVCICVMFVFLVVRKRVWVCPSSFLSSPSSAGLHSQAQPPFSLSFIRPPYCTQKHRYLYTYLKFVWDSV